MKLKFIQINIYKGKYLENLVDFLKKESPDFVSMQEVSGGLLNNYQDKKIDLFEYLKNELGYEGAFIRDVALETGNGHFGTAVLSKYAIVSSNVIELKEFRTMKMEEVNDIRSFPTFPRHLVDATVKVDDFKIHLMSWHGAWTAPPTDTLETLRQAKLVAVYLSKTKNRFILGGDLNALPQSKTVGLINEVANNLMMNSGVLQTTHPKVHKIVPRGYLVDYIFTSNNFKLQSLAVPEVDISDHLPVIASLELE